MPTRSLPAALRADCTRCAALCCFAYPFSHDQGFPIEKPANDRCRHLSDADRCSIHDRRLALGFAACATYDCYGAGQWVTQHQPRGSQVDARTLAMFREVRNIHELLAIIALGLSSSRDAATRAELEAVRQRLERRRDDQRHSPAPLDASERPRLLRMLRATHDLFTPTARTTAPETEL